MTSKIIWIVAGAVVAVLAMWWFGKSVESKDERAEKTTPAE